MGLFPTPQPFGKPGCDIAFLSNGTCILDDGDSDCCDMSYYNQNCCNIAKQCSMDINSTIFALIALYVMITACRRLKKWILRHKIKSQRDRAKTYPTLFSLFILPYFTFFIEYSQGIHIYW